MLVSWLDTRLLTLIIWGFGVVLVFGIVLIRRLEAYAHFRDRAAIREAAEAIGLFLTALASALSIVFVLMGPDASGIRSFLVALALGMFAGVGIVMVTEKPRKHG